MTVQPESPVSVSSTEANRSRIVPNFPKQLQEVCNIMEIWSTEDWGYTEEFVKEDILNPNTDYVRTSLTAALHLGFIELAQKIIEVKKVDNLEEFNFTHLVGTLMRSEPVNWDIVRSVLDFVKAKCPERLIDFKCVFQQENVELIVWWKENFPNFPGTWLATCSLDYIHEVTTQINLNEIQAMELVRCDLEPSVLQFVSCAFFNNVTEDLEDVFYNRDILVLNSKHFIATPFERAARGGIRSYMKWCVARFGFGTIKREIKLANCVDSFTNQPTLTLLKDLLNLSVLDLIENDSAFLTALVRSSYYNWNWVIENFDLSKVEFTFTPQNPREEWFLKLAKVESSTVQSFFNVKYECKPLVEACLSAVEKGMMEAVQWIFANLPQSFTSDFLRQIQIPALEIGNIELLDLFYNMSQTLDATVFNFCLFNHISKPKVLDWIHNKIGIKEIYVHGHFLKDLHPDTLLWFLEHGFLTKESEVMSTFDLTSYIKKHVSKHVGTIIKILIFFDVDDSMILSLIECDSIKDDFIMIHLIQQYNLPKNSLWFIKAAECNRPSLHYFLLTHFKGQFKAWETFTPKPLDFKIRNNQQEWCDGIFDFEKAIGSSLDCRNPEVSMELAIAHLDVGHKDKHPVNEIYKDIIRWYALYYDLKKEHPIWQVMLGKCRTSESKSFIEHDIMGMERKPLTLRELGDGLASGKITLKPNTELSLLLKLCQQVAELSTGTENAEKEAALMQDFQEHILQ